jgi:anti-sigma factor RsiW
MTCRELIDFLDDYLAGDLPADQRTAFDRHLSLCVDCRNYLASYKDTIRLGKSAFAADAPPMDRDVPADVPDGLLKAILAATTGAPNRPE